MAIRCLKLYLLPNQIFRCEYATSRRGLGVRSLPPVWSLGGRSLGVPAIWSVAAKLDCFNAPQAAMIGVFIKVAKIRAKSQFLSR